MAVGTEVVAVRYEDIVADTPISVPYPVYEALDVRVYYGSASLLAVYNTDYTVSLANDFDTFTLTPTASLITKINNLIAADPTEENYITVRRQLDYLTDATAAAVRYTPFTSREFERTVLRFQQLDERMNRALVLSPNFVGDQPLLQLTELQPGASLRVNDAGNAIEPGPQIPDIDAQFELAKAQADRAEREADYAEEWAQSSNPISAQAGGDGVNDRSSKWWAGQASDAADRTATNALAVIDRAWFKTVADLQADNNSVIGYAGSGADFIVAPGDIITARGFRYEVAASGATDNHLETAGGVKLYVRNRATVLAWPVVGDGVTDDGPTIQKALDALLPGECFSLAGGTFACAGVSVGVDNVHVRDGKLIAHASITANAVIKAAPGTTGVQFHNIKTYINRTAITAADCAGIFFDQCSDGKAINCEADGSRNENYGPNNILGTICAILSNDIAIDSCKSFNAHREGIMAQACDDVYITNCEGRNSGYSNIGTSGGSRAHIIACRAYGSGATNITMNSDDSIVAHCFADGNLTNHGILIGHSEEVAQYAENCSVIGNRVTNSGGRGVSAVYAKNCVISDNVIDGVVNYGVYVIPHPTDPGSIVVADNAIDGCTYGIYVFGASDCDVSVNGNKVRNAVNYGGLVSCNGTVAVNDNTVRDSGGGFQVFGHATGATLTGDGIKDLTFSNNILRDIQFNGVLMHHLRQATITGNTLDGVNLSGNVNANVLRLLNTTGGTASSMPTSITIDGNTSKRTPAGTPFFYAQSNIKGDGTITLVAANNNTLPDFTAAKLAEGPGVGASVRVVANDNQIGTDSRYTTFTIASGTTSTVVNNSNIASTYGQLPQMFSTGSEYYTLGARISSIGNGTFTLTHTAPAANVTVIMKVA